MKWRIILAFAVLLLAVSCRQKKAIVRTEVEVPVPPPVVIADSITPVNEDVRAAVVAEAKRWIGVPYKYGGEDATGVDCSGLVMTVFLRAADVRLPRSSREQQKFCVPVDVAAVQPGDLVFFSSKVAGSNVSHVGVMVDGRSFVHSSTSKGVIMSSLDEPYYVRHFHSAGIVPNLKNKASGCPADTVSRAIRDAVRNAF